jgi:hypothetical protein
MNYDRIIEAAKIYSVLVESDDQQEWERLLAEADALPQRDSLFANAMSMVLAGKTFAMMTDNPETLKHFCILADMVGAKVVLGSTDMMKRVAREFKPMALSFTIVPAEQLN